jgi:two-component system LytT family response regulator
VQEAKIQALIVDDEPLARNRIRRLLSAEPDIEVAGECGNGSEAVAFLKGQQADLLFLDVQMPGLDGFGVLEALSPERVPAVVFVTAYDEHALRAFEVHALDYLLKPFDRRRFHETLRRVREHIGRLRNGEVNQRLFALLETLSRRKTSPDRMAIRANGHVLFIRTSNIDWIEAADNYVCLHCGTETHVVRDTLSAVAGRLDTARFIRIHRSTVVNVDRIARLQPWFRGDYRVLLHDGTQLPLSRSYRDRLQDVLLK